MSGALDVVILGLSITSSWGNGHATNYRGLVRALTGRGHRVLFLERDVPWYADHRDLSEPPGGELHLYRSVEELRERFRDRVREADAVVVGSYVPDGVAVGRWVNDTARGVTVFYDIDTPVTLAKLEEGDFEYLDPGLVSRYDLYLSFTGGPVLETLEERYGSPAARSFYCMVDPARYEPEEAESRWDLGYLGTYSEDRQPALERLLLAPARRRPELRFCVAGPGYPDEVSWPDNVERIEHVPPDRHRRFYASQRFTLNVTRERMVRLGWSPSVRLFEAAACETPVITDPWPGLDRFFTPGEEILVASSGDDVLETLENGRAGESRIGRRAREKVLAEHTAEHRAAEFEKHVKEARTRTGGRRRPGAGALRGPARTRAEVERLGPWFHNLRLPDGVETAPDHFLGDFPRYKWREVQPFLPDDLDGWSALDVGCNAGFYSFELARRGARVVGIDHDERYLEQARWARGRFGLDDRIELRRQEVYDLARSDETYDIVLFLGVLYHLRYPLLGLDAVARRVGRILLVQSMVAPEEEVHERTTGHGLDDRDVLLEPGWPRMAFLEHPFEGDPTNWWVPNPACVQAMLRSTGLEIRERPGREIWVCRPREDRSFGSGEELRAAVGG